MGNVGPEIRLVAMTNSSNAAAVVAALPVGQALNTFSVEGLRSSPRPRKGPFLRRSSKLSPLAPHFPMSNACLTEKDRFDMGTVEFVIGELRRKTAFKTMRSVCAQFEALLCRANLLAVLLLQHSLR